jgi:hypothetical protein
MADSRDPLRLVIQQLGIAASPSYRVIVYGDDQKPKHSDFGSAEALLDTLAPQSPILICRSFR